MLEEYGEWSGSELLLEGGRERERQGTLVILGNFGVEEGKWRG